MLIDRVQGWLRRKPATAASVTTAEVVDNADPNEQGRVKVRFAARGAKELWARTATLMAGPNRGSWFIPDVGDEVLVAFDDGDPGRPVVIGALWNAKAQPPEQIGQDNGRRAIVTRSGAAIVIDDTGGDTSITLRTPRGRQLQITDGTSNTIALTDTSGNSIELEPGGVTVDSPARIRLRASTVDVLAATITLDSPVVNASGIVKCDTIIATHVVGSSYTPGAGNIS